MNELLCKNCKPGTKTYDDFYNNKYCPRDCKYAKILLKNRRKKFYDKLKFELKLSR